MKIQKHKTFITIPKRILKDTSISLRAKGYYVCMMSEINVEDEESFKELLEHGYIRITRGGDYMLLITPISQAEEVNEEEFPFLEEPKKTLAKPKKNKNLFDTMLDMVREVASNEDERKLLVDYFSLRLNPKTGSKFHKIASAYQIRLALDSLGDCQDNVLGSIQQSIDRQWAKFYPYRATRAFTSRDNISSSSFTKEELEDIKSTKETF